MFLDAFCLGKEKRRGEEVTVGVLTCRVQPFDSKLATSLDTGVGGDSNIRATIFNLNDADPRANFTGHEFKIGVPRQNLEIFASSDTERATFALTQVKITGGINVKIHSDNPNALTLTFRGKVGPLDHSELAKIQHWFRSERWVTFTEAEASLEFQETLEEPAEESDATMTEDEERIRQTASQKPMFEESGADGRAAAENVNRPLHAARGGSQRGGSRGRKSKGAGKKPRTQH